MTRTRIRIGHGAHRFTPGAKLVPGGVAVGSGRGRSVASVAP